MPRSTLLNLEKCRFLLGTNCELTDSEVEQLRQEMYGLADVAIQVFRTQKIDDQARMAAKPGHSCLSEIPEADRCTVEERAAIVEFEGGLKKPDAERLAFAEWAKSKAPLKKKPNKTPRKPALR